MRAAALAMLGVLLWVAVMATGMGLLWGWVTP